MSRPTVYKAFDKLKLARERNQNERVDLIENSVFECPDFSTLGCCVSQENVRDREPKARKDYS